MCRDLIGRHELRWRGKSIVISCVRLEDDGINGRNAAGTYELIVMKKRTGDEIECRRYVDRRTAESAYLQTVRRYTQEAEAEPLTGKYLELETALRDALKAAEQAYADDPEDDGTCNFDAPVLSLPRWNEEKVTKAAKNAGFGCFKWSGWFGGGRFVFSLPHGFGQSNARSRCAEAAEKRLKALGYDAAMYYQMD